MTRIPVRITRDHGVSVDLVVLATREGGRWVAWGARHAETGRRIALSPTERSQAEGAVTAAQAQQRDLFAKEAS